MSSRSVHEKIRTHRETLETIAESDLPAAWIAKELLELADEPYKEQHY